MIYEANANVIAIRRDFYTLSLCKHSRVDLYISINLYVINITNCYRA